MGGDENTWHDQKKLTKTNTKTMTKTNIFREHLQRTILETCDLWDICSEWWEDTTWPKKIDKDKDQDNDKDKDKDKDILRTPPKSNPRDFNISLSTILTIENLNSWQSLSPDN